MRRSNSVVSSSFLSMNRRRHLKEYKQGREEEAAKTDNVHTKYPGDDSQQIVREKLGSKSVVTREHRETRLGGEETCNVTGPCESLSLKGRKKGG